jgi:hypothetical protein
MFLTRSIWRADSARVEFGSDLTGRDIEALAKEPGLKVLQASSPVSDSTWSMLNSRFFQHRPDVELRVYGFYGSECDLSFAGKMTHVRRFSADCLMKTKHVECIADIPHLQSLSLGIFELQDFDVLRSITPNLTALSIGATRSKKPDLAPLGRFGCLKKLFIEGQNKNIEVLRELTTLEDLTLRSITTSDLSYLGPLSSLYSLEIKLGGIRSFAGIEGKETIKYLELWQIRELSNIEVISHLPGLQNLFLQSLPRIPAMPSLSNAHVLRRVVLANMKGLSDFSEFEWAPSLQEFSLIEGRNQEPEQLLPVLRNSTLKRASSWFGSDSKNNRFLELLQQYGKERFHPIGPFEYL